MRTTPQAIALIEKTDGDMSKARYVTPVYDHQKPIYV